MAKKFYTGIDLASQKAINAGDPTNPGDLTTKSYVDAFVRGLSWKDSVRAATTANGTLATDFENGDLLDGVTLATGDRILIKDQTSGAENGIYVVAASGAPARATDADSAADLIGATVTITEGTTNADLVYRLVTDNVTLDTTALSFTQLGGGGTTYSAGSGLTESPATTFNVGAGDGITVGVDSISLATTAAGTGLTYSSGVLNVIGGEGLTASADSLDLDATVAGAGLTYTTGVVAVGDGDGIDVTADAIAVDSTVVRTPSTVVRKHAENVGALSAGTPLTITHNLNTLDITAQLIEISTGEFVEADIKATAVNTLSITTSAAFSANVYRIVVHG